MATPFQGTVGRLLLCCGVVALCLLAMEAALRVISPLHRFANPLHAFHEADPEIGWRGKPLVDARFTTADFDCRIRHGADGFRAPEAQANPGAPSWIVLGDSFTWGWGVGQGEPFCDLLQGAVGPGLRIVNRGLNGSGTVQQMLLLRRGLASEPTPRGVLVAFCPNDFGDCVGRHQDRPRLERSGDQMELRNSPVASGGIQSGLWRSITGSSRLLSTIRYAFDRMKSRGEDTAFPVTPDGVEAVRTCLEAMRNDCQGKGAEFVVAYVPIREDVRIAEVSERRSALATICSDLGIRLIDPTDRMRSDAAGDPDALFFKSDAHWTARGHRAFADALAAEHVAH